MNVRQKPKLNLDNVIKFCEDLKDKYGEEITTQTWRKEFILHFGRDIYVTNVWFKTCMEAGILEKGGLGRVKILSSL